MNALQRSSLVGFLLCSAISTALAAPPVAPPAPPGTLPPLVSPPPLPVSPTPPVPTPPVISPTIGPPTLPAATTPAITAPTAESTARPLAEGVNAGSLGTSSGCDDENRRFDLWQADLAPGGWVRLFVATDMFDAVLVVETPDGHTIEGDDFVTGLLFPAVEFAPAVAGTYTVRVRGYAEGDAGPYQVGFSRVTPGADGGTLALGEERDGALAFSPLSPAIGSWGSHWFTGSAGQRVVLRVTSPHFDTYAVLNGPNGQVWSNDDANDLGPSGLESELDSTVEAILPANGDYHLMVFSYAGEGAGSYRVRTSFEPPVVLLPGEVVPSTGFAGTHTRGRILGVFAGISDYLDDSDLYGAADDATFLAGAMRLRGLQSAADQVVLTNAQVTRAAIAQAIGQMATRATPEDVVIFFFSGHGDQIMTHDAGSELDGRDETLLLYDGGVTDDELMAMLGTIRANTLILALDSCHAGGFERDFMTAPGRIGLFSSNEDVLSDTGEPVRAGGYLSHYLRRAVLGHGDWRPTDGALAAGELTDYLYTGFLESNALFNPAGGDAPLQILQTDRGSLAYTDILWLYPRQPDGNLSAIPSATLESAPPASDGHSTSGGSCE